MTTTDPNTVTTWLLFASASTFFIVAALATYRLEKLERQDRLEEGRRIYEDLVRKETIRRRAHTTKEDPADEECEGPQ